MGLSWRAVTVAVASLLTAVALEGCDCGKIQQTVYIASPDSSLQPLIDACRTGVALPDQSCPPLVGDRQYGVSCACRPLCFRVLELADQFSGAETLIDCRLHALVDGGAAAGGADAGSVATRAGTVRVAVTYRPSTCE